MDNPLLILVAAPIDASRLRNIFHPGDGSLINLIEEPGAQRYAGWDLQTLDAAKIVKGEYLEVRNGDRKLINLYEDGTLILRVLADNTFLGWGQNESEFLKNPRLNPIALIEVVYNFVDFYRRVVPHFEKRSGMITLRAQIENAFVGENRLYLLPYAIDSIDWIGDVQRYTAPDRSMLKEIKVPADDITETPEVVAFRLVERIYSWFGIKTNMIPYTSETEKKERRIDIQSIIKKH